MTSIPLVLVHGFLGGSDQWQEVQQHFDGKLPVIALDLPSFGHHAHLEAPDSIEGFARYVLGELDRRKIETFYLLGHSMGGMVCQEVARLAPERIVKLVLNGTGASGQLSDRFETFAESHARARADGAEATAKCISATWFKDYADAPAYADCAYITTRAALLAIEAGLTAMEHWSGLNNLPHILSPTLIIWGDRERTYSWVQTEQL